MAIELYMRWLRSGVSPLWASVPHKGGGGSSAPPPAPDPVATAQAQAAANKEAVRESALVNQINQVTPQGSLTYTGEIGQPGRTVTQTLAPAQQQIFDQGNQAALTYGQTANQQLDAVKGKLAQPIDYASLGPAPVANQALRESTLASMLTRQQPQFDRDLSRFETRMANQGIQQGSQAYTDGLRDLQQGQNDFRLAADAQAGGEMARQFGLDSASRDRSISEMIQQRQVPLNELAAMLTGTQVQSPQFVNTSQYNVQAPDVIGATMGAANINSQNAAMAAQSRAQERAGLYGLLGAGAMGAGMMWSDRRLKAGVEFLAALPNGLKLYRFDYAWAKGRVGVMADEVREKFPQAVRSLAGFDMVDYDMLKEAA